MKNGLIESFKKQINNIPYHSIRDLLILHLNDKAESLELAFAKDNKIAPQNIAQSLKMLPRGMNQQLEANPLTIAFAYGSQDLRNQLMDTLNKIMTPADAVDILSKPWGTFALHDGFHGVFLATSKKTRKDLSEWASQLPNKLLLNLFTRSNGILIRCVESALLVLAKSESEFTTLFIKAFQNFSNEELLSLFQTQVLPSARFGGLVQLFASGIEDEEIALLLLDLIKQLDDTQLCSVFYGPTAYGAFQQETDCLMRHLNKFSSRVMYKALHLLARLPEQDIEKILLSGQIDWLNSTNALEAAFAIKDAPQYGNEIAIAFINVLNQSDKLREILYISPRASVPPFLHRLVESHYRKATAYYLELGSLKTEHRNQEGQTAYERASEMNATETMALFQARDIVHTLSDTSRPARKELRRLLKEYPAVVTTKWSAKLSLAHMAINKRNPRALRLFLKHGASPNAEDINGQSVLDYAFSEKELKNIKAIVRHPDTVLSKADKKGSYPLSKLLKIGDFSLVWLAIHNLNAKADAWPSFAEGFKHLQGFKQNLEALNQTLALTNKDQTMESALNDYCVDNKDSLSLFLMYAGLNLSQPETCSIEAQVFVINHLNTIENKQMDTLEKNGAKKQLMLFFFAIKPPVLLNFLKLLKLTPEQGRQIDLILCQGLKQPLFFTSLSLDDFSTLERYFLQKNQTLSTVANFHFQLSDLSLLPPTVLVHYAKHLNEQTLYQLAMNRFNAALIVLSLDKSFQSVPKVEDKLRNLLLNLEKKMKLFNAPLSPEAFNEFLLMLNLASSPDIKKIIHSFLPKNALFYENCIKAFSSFHHSQTLLPDSVLRELFIEFASKANIAQQASHQRAFSEILLIASPEEVLKIVERQLYNKKQWEIKEALFQAIIEGVMHHPAPLALVRPLFQWAIQENFTSKLIHYLPQLLKNDTSQISVDEILAKALEQNRATLIPIMDIQVLCFEDSTLPSMLMDKMALWNEQDFLSLIQLSEQAGLSELYTVFSVFLDAKVKKLPFSLALAEHIKDGEALNQLVNVHKVQYEERLSLLALKEGLYFEGRDVVSRLTTFSSLIKKEENALTAPAISLWIKSYYPILTGDSPIEIRAFIHAMALVMKYARPSLQSTILQDMPEEILSILLTQCLLGMHSDNDAGRAKSCSKLLSYFANNNALNNKNNTKIITRYLGQYDTAILKQDTLRHIAESILKADSNDLNDLTLNGIWIIRLLTSAQFLAATDKKTVHLLFKRLCLYIRALKLAEYNSLSNFLNSKISFEEFGEEMETWRAKLLKDPEQTAFLHDKLGRILKFRDEPSLHEIHLQARLAIEQALPEVANQARAVLLGYVNDRLSNRCSNFLFQKMANLVYWKTQQLGDIQLAKNTLYQWISDYLPDLIEIEFTKKNQTLIYNKTGQELGFINHLNYAMSPSNGLLIEMEGIKPGMELFDATASIIGVLKSRGEVARSNLFQKTTSAEILANVPSKELEQSNTLLLLLHDVLFVEKTTDTLYESEALLEDEDKRLWIESLLNQELTLSTEVIPEESIRAMVAYHQTDMFSVLSKTKLAANAKTLFFELLANDRTREALFKNTSLDFPALLKRLKSEEILAHFLLNHPNKKWYPQGLAFFAKHLKKEPSAIVDAMLLLDPEKECFKIILDSFLGTEEVASILLKGFLTDEYDTIQDSISDVARQLTYLFDKTQITACIQKLVIDEKNEQHWWCTARYRLLLMIFAAHQEVLFEQEELRYSRGAWTGNELMMIAQFVRVHFSIRNNPDKDLKIGGKLLSELVFRSPNFGPEHFKSLYYRNKTEFNPQIAGFMLEKKKPVLSESVKSTVMTPFITIRNWFDSKHAKQMKDAQYLKDKHALIDWKKMADKSWRLTDGPQLSSFCAGVSSYIGPSAFLESVLDHFICSPELLTNKSHLYALSHLLIKIPHHEVSPLIFLSLARHPEHVNATIMKDMAYFYQKKHNSNHIEDPIQSSLDLIEYFGQQKEYKMAAKCCEILKRQAPLSLQPQIQTIHSQVEVEGRLNSSSNRWYFKLLCFFKRLWHNTKPSSFVCPCDQPISIPPLKVPPEIGDKRLGGKHHEQEKQFFHLLKQSKLWQRKKEPLLPPSETPHQRAVFRRAPPKQRQERCEHFRQTPADRTIKV